MAIFQVRSVWSGPIGTPYYSNHYFGDTVSLVDVATILRSFYGEVCGGVGLGFSVQIDSTVNVLDPVSGDLTGFEAIAGGAAIPGRAPGDLLPAQTQGLISLATVVVAGTRRLQGRFYAPAPVEQNNAGSRPDNDYISLMQGAAQRVLDFNQGKDDDARCWVIWSRKYGVVSAIRAARSENQWATLRSRGSRG